MKKDTITVIECLEFPQGFEIDLEEGWQKLISRQFGGHPGRGFGELIQNLLDSYPSGTPWQERRGEIKTTEKTISITDYGEGMSRERLKLLTTLGGTDKCNDSSKIGTFGIGFFSIFSPKLGTEKVIVTTQCEGHTVELVYDVEHLEKRPKITTKILTSQGFFSTKIEVRFNNQTSAIKCSEYAIECLKYYPCRISINGQFLTSIWDEAKKSGAVLFSQDQCDGFIESKNRGQGSIRLFCKYQYLTTLSVPTLITGGHDMTHDLRDYQRKQVPFLSLTDTTLNCNNLMVTISRDSFFLNSPYNDMIKVLSQQLFRYLDQTLTDQTENGLILANQYILIKKIKAYLTLSRDEKNILAESHETRVIRRLCESKAFQLGGKKERYSLIDLKNMHNPSQPFFFSVEQTNLRWMKNSFTYDFIVLPEPVSLGNGSPDLYDALFGELFVEVINIDTIMGDNEKLKRLVDRGIASKSSLSPKCRFIRRRKLSEKEQLFCKKIDAVLKRDAVKHAIEENLFFRFKKINTAFFYLDEQCIILATGLFEKTGKAIEESGYSNFDFKDNSSCSPAPKTQTILLGLSRAHPFIQHLIDVEDPHMAYYALIFLAYELALCQKRLVPYSPFFHKTTQRLAADMRNALMQVLLSGM